MLRTSPHSHVGVAVGACQANLIYLVITMFCGNCGNSHRESDRYCEVCGAEISVPDHKEGRSDGTDSQTEASQSHIYEGTGSAADGLSAQFCGNCGNPLSTSDQFCEKCGSKKQNTGPEHGRHEEISESDKLKEDQHLSSSVGSGSGKRTKDILIIIIILCLAFGIGFVVICNRVVAELEEAYSTNQPNSGSRWNPPPAAPAPHPTSTPTPTPDPTSTPTPTPDPTSTPTPTPHPTSTPFEANGNNDAEETKNESSSNDLDSNSSQMIEAAPPLPTPVALFPPPPPLAIIGIASNPAPGSPIWSDLSELKFRPESKFINVIPEDGLLVLGFTTQGEGSNLYDLEQSSCNDARNLSFISSGGSDSASLKLELINLTKQLVYLEIVSENGMSGMPVGPNESFLWRGALSPPLKINFFYYPDIDSIGLCMRSYTLS